MYEVEPYQRILVIRLGALGDLVLCAPAFQAIRTAYPRAIISLLTQPVWADFGRTMPWFDQVLTDARPSPWQIGAWSDLACRVRRIEPQCVFDLQGKPRQSVLYALLGGLWRGVDWFGAGWRCRYPRVWPPQPQWHFTDFIAAQLQVAHVTLPEQTDFSWLDAPVVDLNLPQDFVLLIPGSAATRPEKRWPHFAALARHCHDQGMAIVMIGTRAEVDVLAAIKTAAPAVYDLGGRTSLPQIGALARRAKAVVGNDTGPTHIAAAVGVPTLSLFSGRVDPVWSCPKGEQAVWLQKDNLSDLPVEQVWQKLQELGVSRSQTI